MGDGNPWVTRSEPSPSGANPGPVRTTRRYQNRPPEEIKPQLCIRSVALIRSAKKMMIIHLVDSALDISFHPASKRS